MARSMMRISLSLFFAGLFVLRVDATQLVQGTTPTGALYAFAVPDDWSGDLIIYGHGIVDPAAPLLLPTTQDGFAELKEALLQRGFAVAYSSYSENGYALKACLPSAARASGSLQGAYWTPARPRVPNGPFAGRSGGADARRAVPPQIRRHARAVRVYQAEVFRRWSISVMSASCSTRHFPSVLPGDVITVPVNALFRPTDPLFVGVLTALQHGLFTPGTPTLAFATAAKLPFTSPQELIAGAMTAIGFNLRFTNDLLERTRWHPFYDNLDTLYPVAVDPIAGRFEASRRGLKFFERFYAPSGDIRSPMLTLHTMRDPVVPVLHQAMYADLAPTHWLVQRTTNSFGHCAFNQQEVLTAFDDLVRWVTRGERPVGGDATMR